MTSLPSEAVPGRRNKRWILVASMLAVAVAATAAIAMRSPPPKDDPEKKNAPPALEFSPSEVVHLAALPLDQNLLVTGTLDAVNKVTLRAKVAAEVRSIPVREGDRVSAGAVVATIDTTDAQARLAERVGEFESARANLALTEKNRAVNKDLLAQGYISQNAYDAIESGYQANVGKVRASEAGVALARNAVQDARVIAPIAGIVSKRHVQPGEKVNFDSALVSIVDLRKLELQAMVPTGEIARVHVGARARMRVDGFGERVFEGRVERIAPATEPGTRALAVLIAVANPDEALKAGMFATGTIAIDKTGPVPTLPADAVRAAGSDSHVWVIADGKLHKRSVRTGRRDEEAGRIEIVSGVDGKDIVLAARFDNLREGGAALVARGAAGSAVPNAPAAQDALASTRR